MYSQEKALLKELATVGGKYTSIDDIYRTRLNPIEVEVILKWLPLIYQEHIGSGEHLIRSLISTYEPFDPSTIIDLFENSDYNYMLKWTMAYVLSISKTFDISDWVREQLLKKDSSFERSGLLDGLIEKANIRDADELMNVFKELFDKYIAFEVYQKLFQKYARHSDISFLEKKLTAPNLEIYTTYIRDAEKIFSDKKSKKINERFEREVNKMIATISKRKKVHKFPVSNKY